MKDGSLDKGLKCLSYVSILQKVFTFKLMALTPEERYYQDLRISESPNADRHAHWTPGNECSCPSANKMANNIRWIEVRMFSMSVHNLHSSKVNHVKEDATIFT